MLTEGNKIPGGLTGIIVHKTKDGYDEKEISFDKLIRNRTVVLYFYPKDNTPGCSTEALAFQQYLKDFEKLNVRIIGCSRDSAKSHCSFIDKKSLTFELLSDPTGKITEFFEVWAEKSMYGRKYMGILRSTFIIEENKIIKVYPKVSVKTHAFEVLDFIKGNL
jgi:peroxiredoxin Q/BCP